MLRGSDIILKAVEEATCCSVGKLSDDKMFGVDIVQCQGACVNAPMMVVDDDYYVCILFYPYNNYLTELVIFISRRLQVIFPSEFE